MFSSIVVAAVVTAGIHLVMPDLPWWPSWILFFLVFGIVLDRLLRIFGELPPK